MAIAGEAVETTTPSSFGPPGVARFVREQTSLVMVLFILLAVALLWPYRHFAGDDAYITFRFARNLASGDGFSFNPGVPTYGSTAPLWVYLIAGLSRLGVGIPEAAHTMNWLFTIVNVVLFFRLACTYLGKNAFALVATLLFIADPWFIRWSLSGMENALALCLLMGLLLSQASLRNSGRVNWAAPILGALAALCRPEMTLLGGLLVLDTLLFERRRLLANLAAMLIAYLVIVTPWVVYAISVFPSLVPNTITAKVTRDHVSALIRVLQYLATFWVFQGLAIIVVGASRSWRLRFVQQLGQPLGPWFLPLAWAAILPAFYIAGGAPVAGRYMVFGLPCYLLLGVAAWAVLWSRFPKLIGGALVTTLLLVAFVQYRYCWYITRWPQGMDPRIIDAVLNLKRVSKSTDLVAADQIGVLGYYSDRPVLDIFGLISPEIMPYRKLPGQGPVWHYVYERRAQYVLAIDTIDTLSGLDPAYKSLTLVQQVTVQREGAGAADNPPTVYYLYRTNWTQ
jgi:hypothetical protein